MSKEWTMKMKELIEERILNNGDLKIGRLEKGELVKLFQHDPLLQRMLFNQQCLEQSISEEFLFNNYCLYVLKDRQEKTKMFLEETEKDVSSVINEMNLQKYITPVLYARKNELFPVLEQYRDKTKTSLHQISTMLMSLKLARLLNMPEDEQRAIAIGMLLHDIGKYRMPWEIINKEGPLSEKEWELMHIHPEIGSLIVQKSGYDIPEKSMDIILYHHEKLDGSGYPYGIKDIPDHVAIATVVDIFDALIESRHYREKQLSIHEAIDILIQNAQGPFSKLNKKIVDCLVAANRESRSQPEETGYYERGGIS